MQAIEQLLQQAVTHHRAGDLAAAEECCRRVLQLDPRHAKANHNLGALCAQQGRIAEALPFFIAALEADPAHGQYWLSYIDALRQAGRLDEARQVLTLAREGGLQGEDVDALAHTLDDGAAAASRPYDERQLEADAGELIDLFNQGRYGEAEALAHRMVAQSPGYGPGWKMLGVLLDGRGASEQALHPMQQAVALLPQDAEAHNNLGIVLQRLNRLDEAEASYRLALQFNPDFAQAHNNLGSALQAQGRMEEAEAAYRQALQLAPGYARACNNLGSLLMLDTKRLDEAAANCLQALEIEPANAEALYNLGMVFHLQERLDEAEAAFRYLLRLYPAHADGQYRLGNVLFSAGRKAEAESCYRAAVQLKPDHVDALNNLAVVLESRKQLSEAEACCRKALQVKPDSADGYNCLGVVLHGLGRPDEAEASYRRALELKPDLASAWVNLATVLQSRGHLREAEACGLRALQLRPDHAAAQVNLGYLYCELDDLERADAAFRKARELDPTGYGLDATVYLAVLSLLAGNHARCRELLDASRIAQLNEDRHNHVRGYWVYLDRLLSQLPQPGTKADARTIYVVGESHALSAHRLEVRYRKQAVRCMSEWILGCKQWHLGNGSNNKYKQKFDAVMARLPRRSTILLAIGEIDCRHDEGIIRAWKKFPEKDLSEVARATVDAYIDYIAGAARRHGHHFIVGGVPAPNVELDTLPPETAQQLVFLIRRFNAFLKDRALSAGMEFLDVYALTDRGDGVADGRWHIDAYHLKPLAIAEAMEKYCFATESGNSSASVKMRTA